MEDITVATYSLVLAAAGFGGSITASYGNSDRSTQLPARMFILDAGTSVGAQSNGLFRDDTRASDARTTGRLSVLLDFDSRASGDKCAAHMDLAYPIAECIMFS